MNKISKKIVSLVTMAAFALTLVPAAAFGAAVTSDSTVNVPESSQELTLNADSGKTATVEIKVSQNIADIEGNVYVWVEKDGNVYSDVTYVKNDAIGFDKTGNNKTGDLKWAGRLATPKADTYEVQINFTNAGTYTVHAGVETSGAGSAQNTDVLTQFDVAPYGSNTIVVKAADTTVNKISFNASDDVDETTIPMKPNSFGVQKVTAYVSGVYTGTDSKASVDSKVVSIENDNEGKGVYVYKTGTETATTEETVKNGQISFDVRVLNGAVPGKYPVTLSVDGEEATLYVNVEGANAPTTIEVVDTDSKYVATTEPEFDGVAEVVFKDANGTPVELGSTVLLKSFVNAPEGFDKSTVDKLSLEQVPGTNNYKLKYNGNLVAGEYTVRLGIDGQTGANAVAELSFTAAKVGDTVSLEIATANDVETIVSGGVVSGTVYAIDANGIRTKADSNVVLGFANSAAVDTTSDTLDKGTNVNIATNDGAFSVKAKSDEKYYGSKITLIAFDENAKVQATKELTVVDGLSNNTLAFDSETGSVAKNNTVNVSVVDENGKAVTVSGTAYAYVESTSNEDAKVDVSFNKNTTDNGKIAMTVYSDKETTADIVVAVQDNVTKAIYANTLTYAFGEQDIPVGTTVVMTIGSSDFVVNNDVVTKEDSAPYVANDRTYVPFRALGEALGAEVVWDEDARTVTYTLGNTEVVMTIGETTYTVNGDEKTMDVAPEITGDRTYVPVRFVGEALGFKVTALSASDGTTASVVFQK